MYLSTNDGTDNVEDDDSLQIQQANTLSVTSNPSQSSSPSYPTLLVIDDNSNSNDSSLNTNNIPSNTMSLTAQTTNVQATPSSPPVSTIDAANDTPEQQRRRNSSIAKLLGGRPLHNQQYEEIHQQILVDQTAQNININSDNGTDNEIQRSRSSITRTLLMNSERNNNASTTTTKGRPTSPQFSKDFEYLIRRELDIEHAPSTFNRNSSSPSVFQNLNSARNTPPVTPQPPSNSSLKRKRPNPKQTVSTTTTPTNNKTSLAPFVIRNPFELDLSLPSLIPPMNPTTMHRSQQHQNGLFRFDTPYHHQHHHHHQQQQYPLPMNNSATNPPSFICRKLNINSPSYAQFKMHPDRVSSTPSSMTSPCNCCRYRPTIQLALPTPVSPLSTHMSSPSITTHNNNGTSACKTKAMYTQPDVYEIPVQRSCATILHQSIISSSSSTSSSPGLSIPLKKRLLHAYSNEQRPSSSL